MSISKQLIRMNVSDLIPYENNPRRNEDAIAVVAESIRQCENIDPIEVDENNVILSGHTRRMALMDEGITETDVIVVSGLSEEQKKKYRILANKTAEFSGWDFAKLEEELRELDFGEFDFGFDEPVMPIGTDDHLQEQDAVDVENAGGNTCICPNCGLEFEP